MPISNNVSGSSIVHLPLLLMRSIYKYQNNKDAYNVNGRIWLRWGNLRQHKCKHYDRCLSRHAYAGTSFTCTNCPNMELIEMELTHQDLIGSLTLLLAIFRPDVHVNQNDLTGAIDVWVTRDRVRDEGILYLK